jgi:hypothetical protein
VRRSHGMGWFFGKFDSAVALRLSEIQMDIFSFMLYCADCAHGIQGLKVSEQALVFIVQQMLK